MTYAHKQAEQSLRQVPPKQTTSVPIAEAINAWTLISGCYMGIEQTMKLLILMRRGIKRAPPDLRKGNRTRSEQAIFITR